MHGLKDIVFRTSAVAIVPGWRSTGGSSAAPKPPTAIPSSARRPGAPAASTDAPGRGPDRPVGGPSRRRQRSQDRRGRRTRLPEAADLELDEPRMRFRTLQYDVPGTADGSGAELVFSLFMGGDGGHRHEHRSMGRPVPRPRGRAAERGPDRGRRRPHVHRMETAAATGDGPAGPRPGQMQFAAIIERPDAGCSSGWWGSRRWSRRPARLRLLLEGVMPAD